MSDFNLEKFLKNYKPAKLDFGPYLKCEKLKGYEKMKDLSDIVPTKTYIKHIKTSDAFQDKKYNDHIHYGGLVLAGGIYVDGKFEKTESKWTHFQMKVKIPLEDGSFESKVYVIKIINYYIFFKYSKTS